MSEGLIKNFKELATTPDRRIALEIVEAGLSAINTEKAISSSMSLKDNVLLVEGKEFDLTKFKNIKIVGFGKASTLGALALEKILGSKIKQGAVVGLSKINCKYIETFAGTHPRPSEANLKAGEKIYEIIKNSSEEDLIIVLVSGGGSALLCYGEDECEQGIKLYDSFLKSGKTINEINTVRKHLSFLKGGGLARIAYPATIIGLIFSDVPGDNIFDVASGPTYKDETTITDAETILEKYNLGKFNLIETTKEDRYFKKVYNFVLVSNKIAIKAMVKKAQEFSLETSVVSTNLYDEINKSIEEIFSAKKNNCVVLAAGEPSIMVPANAGKGGRNLQMGLSALKNEFTDKENLKNSVFISFASDGMDNSDMAGAIVDKSTFEKAEKLNLNANDYFERFDSYDFFKKTDDLILTGSTGANVSDLMILLTQK